MDAQLQCHSWMGQEEGWGSSWEAGRIWTWELVSWQRGQVSWGSRVC